MVRLSPLTSIWVAKNVLFLVTNSYFEGIGWYILAFKVLGCLVAFLFV